MIRLAGIAGLLLCLTVEPVRGQSDRIPAATSGVTRVLAVFARFADDTDPGVGCRAGRGWPLTPGSVEPVPAYATKLFATSPDPPFGDSTATEYFFRQSGGELILVGDVFPEVVVSDEPASYYLNSNGRGYGHLTAEIVRKIDPDVDFRAYDNNPADGVVDQMFIFLRRDESGTFTGVADLRGTDRVRGNPPEEPVADGVRISWLSSGSYIYNERPGHIISQSYMVRMVAHEFGHHLWNPRRAFSSHIPAISDNSLPGNDTNMIGYALMAGRGGGDDGRGDLLISAPEREALGWLEPIVLRPGSDSVQTIILGDYYQTGEAVRIDALQIGEYRASFYVANRQRAGWFDRYRIDAPEGCTAYEMGLLRTTGLLIQLAEWRGRSFALDVLPADNTMQLSTENRDYEGDLFSDRSATQITPFTTPSTSLPDGGPTWFGVDDIRMAGRADSSMQFTFIPDFRRHAIVREDSRVENVLGRVRIQGDLIVTGGSTLEVESGSYLDIEGRLRIDEGAAVVAADGARITTGGVARFFFAETFVRPGFDAD